MTKADELIGRLTDDKLREILDGCDGVQGA